MKGEGATGHEALRREYAAWLEANLPDDYRTRSWRYRLDLEFRAEYQRAAFEAGWLMPSWPPQLGGRDLDRAADVAVRLEAAERGAPKLPNVQTVGVVAPAIRQFGSPEQRSQHLIPALRGDSWWALGMSEPEAGSDLASLRTRAERRGDSYVVNGQKTWTTQAHQSRWCMLYCRTDPQAERHRGISCLILDLRSAGVTIRPIPTAWPGTDEFCEVFLEDVRVPEANLLGPLNGGWQVAMSALGHERDMIWIMNFVEVERGLEEIRSRLAESGAAPDVEVGRLLADAAAIRLTGERSVLAELAGRAAPESQTLKLFGSESLQRAWDLALRAAGPSAAADPELLFEVFDAVGATIYGGTSEIQRNIIGERVLGLPR